MTYERLRALPELARFPRPGVTQSALDKEAGKQTDTEVAEALQRERDRFFAYLTPLKARAKIGNFTPRVADS